MAVAGFCQGTPNLCQTKKDGYTDMVQTCLISALESTFVSSIVGLGSCLIATSNAAFLLGLSRNVSRVQDSQD